MGGVLWWEYWLFSSWLPSLGPGLTLSPAKVCVPVGSLGVVLVAVLTAVAYLETGYPPGVGQVCFSFKAKKKEGSESILYLILM